MCFVANNGWLDATGELTELEEVLGPFRELNWEDRWMCLIQHFKSPTEQCLPLNKRFCHCWNYGNGDAEPLTGILLGDFD